MTDLAALFATVYRDYKDDGVASSGPNEPAKSDIRGIGPAIASEILARYSAPVAGVQSRTVATPPGSPSAGQKWIVPAGGTGVFSGQAGKVAEYSGSAYVFTAPTAGYTAFVLDEVELYGYDGAAWKLLTGAAIAKALLSELATITTAPADKEAHVYADVIGTTVSRARASNVATIVYAAAHGLSVGEHYNQRGLSGSGYNGRVTVASVPSPTSVTYASTGGDESTTADAGGSADRNGVYRSDGAGGWPWISDLSIDVLIAQFIALKLRVAPYYSSVSAGLSDVASGAYFTVRPSAYSGMASDVYLNNSGVASYQFSVPAGGPGKTLDTSYTSASGFIYGVVDALGRVLAGCDAAARWSGKFVTPGSGLVESYDVLGRQKLTVGGIGGANFDGSVASISGYLWGVVDSAGRILGAVRPNAKWSGNFVEAGAGLSTTFDGFGRQTLTLSTLGALTSTIVCDGDSLTAGSGGSGGFPAKLVSLFPLRTILNKGVPGQTSTQIAMRDGSIPFGLTLSGNAMTSGANSVTAIGGNAIVSMSANSAALQPLSTAADNNARTLAGTLCNVHGALSRSASGGPPSTSETYSFTPDVGATLPQHVPPGSIFTPDTGNVENAIKVIWIGRNNYSSSAQVLADVAAEVAMLNSKRFIILSIVNGSFGGESAGGSGYNAIMALNASLQAAYPRNFLDIRRYLIDHGLADAGMTATSQDLTDIGNDLAPTQLRADQLHYVQAAYDLIGLQIGSFITTKGW